MPTAEQLWSDPANWTGGLLYFSRADRRLIVPKRRPAMGWTINFGRRRGWLVLAGLLVTAIAVPLALARISG